MLTKLFLIRHGVTQWNKEKRYCGLKDVPLSKLGKTQAKALCRRMRSLSFDKIYSSDRKRAYQTARIIFKSRKITKIRELREINFGVLEGLCHNEILKRYPLAYRKWLKDPVGNCIPKAENIKSFKKRVNAAIKRIISRNSGKTVAIVCHGGTISVFINGILKKKNFWRYIPKSASISIVEFRKNKARLKSFNKH